MNCKEAEQAILLAETGELSDRKLRKLETHLSTCTACAQYRQNALRIQTSARAALPAGEPSSEVMASIRLAAQARPASRIAVLRRPLLQVLAYAAALAVLVGGWLLFSSPRQPQSSPINEFIALMAVASENLPPIVEAQDDSRREQELRALGRELLIMEGLGEEEWNESGIEEAFPTADEEPSPTALQSRSIASFPPSACG